MTTENAPEKCCSTKRCCCKCLCLLALLVGLLGAGLTWFLVPARYEAQAWILTYSQVPYTVFQTPEGRDDYENFLATQFATIKSPLVLAEVLRDPRIVNVKWIPHSKAPVRELERRIQVSRRGQSEYFTISCRDPWPEDAKAVVDAVVMAYIARYKSKMEELEFRLTSDMMQEKTAYENIVKAQQKIILELIKQAEDVPAESAQAQEDAANLTFLQAKLQRDLQVLDKISERIATLQTEVHSPGRVVLEQAAQLPTVPCETPLPLAILVGVALFGLTLVGGYVWRRLR